MQMCNYNEKKSYKILVNHSVSFKKIKIIFDLYRGLQEIRLSI